MPAGNLASAVGSYNIFNGTTGSILLKLQSQLGGVTSGDFFDDTITANKPLVLEATTGGGVGDFHVWYIVLRTGAGSGATNL